MTESELKQIEERAAKAAPGPWRERHWKGPIEWEDGIYHSICGHGPLYKLNDTTIHQSISDAEFIAHAREDVPALCGEIRRLKEALMEINKFYLTQDMTSSKAVYIMYQIQDIVLKTLGVK